MWIIAALSLTLVIALCVIGVFSPWFHDNLMQRVGMVAMVFGIMPRLSSILSTQQLDATLPQMEAAVCAYAGMALYACGTAYSAWTNIKHNGGSTKPL
jgi:Na+-translocating ferredoxin:NAD+ oxidoreductase RNF subunit RnfB